MSPYRYLNRDDRWPSWRWRGLDLGEDGVLALGSVPRLAASAPASATLATLATLAGLAAPDGPAGLAPAGIGAPVFYSDPAGDRLWRIDPCDGSAAPVPCFGGSGWLPARLRRPRGLAFHPSRRLLLVADSGNHRIQLVDPTTCRLAGIWGQADLAAPPRSGSAPGQLDTPWNLAVDAHGDTYVVDYGNRRVQKFGLDGGVQAGFCQQAAGAGMTLPVAVAVMPTPPAASTPSNRGTWTVLVLDGGAAPRICVFSPDGALLHVLALPPAAAQPLALAADACRIYVGDNASRHLLVLAADGTALGEAEAFSGPIAGLALAPADNALWLHPGSGSNGAAPLRLDLGGGRRRDGVLWGGPFGPYAGAGEPVIWHHVEALAELLAGSDTAVHASDALASAFDGGHLQLFFATADSPAAAPPAPADSPLDPFGPAWTALPPDALQGLIRGTPAVYLWLGAHFTGEGQQSARLSQVRIDFDPVTWSQYLPAIYREDTADPELLERFLALFASGFHDVEAEIRHLGRRLDVTGAPPSWLPWLAGWVGIELEEGWTADRQREAIAGAFAAAAQRGTVRGLAAALRFQAGVDVHLAEPILGANWWSLPADSAAATSGTAIGGGLGFDTVLAPTGLEGAVLGTTAALDRSYLTDDEESPGAHLYAGLAHQFAVQIYERQVADPRRRAQLIATLEREKPAHTSYRLCVVEPRLRVGFQAVLGVDTVVGGPPPPRRLGGGGDLVLGGASPGRIGDDDRVGIGTRLGAGWRPPSSLAGPAR